MSALSTSVLTILDIRETIYLFGYSVDWKWFILGSFIFFLVFIIWWIGGLESKVRQIEHAKPNLLFAEYRETEIYDEDNVPQYHGLQAWFVNRPKTSTADSVAEDVTARIRFYDKTTKETLSVYGLWILSVALDFAGYKGVINKIDRIPPNDEPCKLAIAVKWQRDDSAYAFVRESRLYSETGDYREPSREIKKGTHYVAVHIRGTKLDQPPIWFTLTNPGQGKELSLSSPIKKPNLRKEGFQTE